MTARTSVTARPGFRSGRSGGDGIVGETNQADALITPNAEALNVWPRGGELRKGRAELRRKHLFRDRLLIRRLGPVLPRVPEGIGRRPLLSIKNAAVAHE